MGTVTGDLDQMMSDINGVLTTTSLQSITPEDLESAIYERMIIIVPYKAPAQVKAI